MMPGPPLMPGATSESSGVYVYVHVIGASGTAVPSPVSDFADRCTASPVRTTSSLIVMSIDFTGFAATLKVLDAFALSAVAVIVARPGVLPVTLPHLSTLATAGFELAHVAL